VLDQVTDYEKHLLINPNKLFTLLTVCATEDADFKSLVINTPSSHFISELFQPSKDSLVVCQLLMLAFL